VIVYLDSSVLARAYLSDEVGHSEAVALLNNREIGLVTGSWTRIEVSGALVRAARAVRGDSKGLLQLLDSDLAEDGNVTVVGAEQREIEGRSLDLVRRYGIRAMDAWHLAVAALTLPNLAEPDEEQGFATRDEALAAAARRLGFKAV
jgi:predicted nucleic acid-binding protein